MSNEIQDSYFDYNFIYFFLCCANRVESGDHFGFSGYEACD